MAKTTETTQAEVSKSVSELYSELLAKRDAAKAEQKARKEAEKAAKREAKANESEEDKEKRKLSKAEKREAELENWRSVIENLTGDDILYSPGKKKKKKKYRKWIGEDDPQADVVKPKKKKKRNYQKEFEPELNMLRRIVAEQNKFTADLQKRFQNAAGPATKDAAPLNKALVDLSANINTSRSNSLGMLRAIGDLKKTIANLYMEQKKLEAKEGGKGTEFTDVGLLGSSIASMRLGDAGGFDTSADISMGESIPQASTVFEQMQPASSGIDIPEFDPNSWNGGPSLGEHSATALEAIPHEIVVEYHKDDQKARIKAVDANSGEELVGYPVPTINPSDLTFNEKDGVAKGEFDQTYRLEVV